MVRVFNNSKMLVTVCGISIMPKKSHTFNEMTPALLHATSSLEDNGIIKVFIYNNEDVAVVEEKQVKTTKRKTKLVE